MNWSFWRKSKPSMGAAQAAAAIVSRTDPLRYLDPDRIARAIGSFRHGYLREMAEIISQLEERDDTMRTASRKAFTAASRCPHEVLIVEGEEKNPRALLHRDILTRFWANVRVRDVFARNASGGISRLKKEMAAALSHRWAVHEITWEPSPSGIRATFWRVPLSRFENRTGALRYLETDGSLDGRALEPYGWLVTQGDGVGIAAAVASTAKRLSLQDWLLYSERCGQPGVHAATDAEEGSPGWQKLLAALPGLARDWALLTGKGVDIKAVDLSVKGTLPYPELVARMDRAIAALYRGADLSTVSGGDGGDVGASLQGDETAILDADTCEMISESLQQQVEPFVIRWSCGDAEPLAYISVSLPEKPFTELDLKADETLLRMGVRLSRKQLLPRYGRTEAAKDDPDDALTPPAGGSAVRSEELGVENQLGVRSEELGVAMPRDKKLLTPNSYFLTPHSSLLTPDFLPLTSDLSSEAAYEAAALEALAVARAKGLEGLQDALLDALNATDEGALKAKLEAIYTGLPALIGAVADEDTENLMQRILLGAMEQGEKTSKS